MGRAKVKLEPIAKERSRNTTFQKRTKGIKKKAYEFSTLCGVDACLIVYGPKQGGRFVEPETWPEDREDVLNIIERFRKHNTEGRGRRHVGLPDYIEDQTKKLRCELARLRQRNNNVKYPTWDERINDFSEEQLKTLAAALSSKLELVNMKIDLSEGNHFVMDDVTGLIEYSAPTLLNHHQNPSPPPSYTDYTMDDMKHMHHQYQPRGSYFMPVENLQRMSIDYGHTDPSLVFQTTRVISDMDYMAGGVSEGSNRYGGYSSIFSYPPGTVIAAPMSNSNQIYCNPTLPPIDEMPMSMQLNNAYFSRNMHPQPMVQSYIAPQLHHQIDEFSEMQDYQVNINGVIDSNTSHILDDHHHHRP